MPIPNPNERVYEEPELVYSIDDNAWYFERFSYVPNKPGGRFENSQLFRNSKTAEAALSRGRILWRQA
jgi:hypothetical protein